MTTNILALVAALAVLALIGVPSIVYVLVLVAGIAPALWETWRSRPAARLAARAALVAKRTRYARTATGRRHLMNGSGA